MVSWLSIPVALIHLSCLWLSQHWSPLTTSPTPPSFWKCLPQFLWGCALLLSALYSLQNLLHGLLPGSSLSSPVQIHRGLLLSALSPHHVIPALGLSVVSPLLSHLCVALSGSVPCSKPWGQQAGPKYSTSWKSNTFCCHKPLYPKRHLFLPMIPQQILPPLTSHFFSCSASTFYAAFDSPIPTSSQSPSQGNPRRQTPSCFHWPHHWTSPYYVQIYFLYNV